MGCYPSNWKGVIVEEAMAHPAKFSSRLIRRIYAHLVDEGWVKAGDSVIDPFGGVALGAYDAMRLGLHWHGVELEERFHKIGQENIHLWGERYGTMPTWGTAELRQGDSRKLGEVLQCQVSSVVTSPPYAESIQTSEKGSGIDYSKSKTGGKGRTAGREAIATGYGRAVGQLGMMKGDGFTAAISSPPFLQSDGGTPEPKPGGVIDRAMYERHAAGNHKAGGYGRTDGQLHHMQGGGFEAVVSSPPFAQQAEGHGIADSMTGKSDYPLTNSALQRTKNAARSAQGFGYQEQGETDGQLANMEAKGFDAAVTSPPFESSLSRDRVDASSRRELAREMGISNAEHISAIDMEKIGKRDQTYGATAGQLAEESGDDFWLAAREIVEQVYQSLTPGGHACWVVKDYVKSKKVVPFCDQWRQLCEAVGFETLHEHHAMLVHGKQMTLEGGVHVKESKSFFRRIAEKNGSPRIDFEVVLCMVKP
jgi:hypothetical protein